MKFPQIFLSNLTDKTLNIKNTKQSKLPLVIVKINQFSSGFNPAIQKEKTSAELVFTILHIK